MTSQSPISLSSRGEWSLRTPVSSLSSLSEPEDDDDDDVVEEIFTPMALIDQLPFESIITEPTMPQDGHATSLQYVRHPQYLNSDRLCSVPAFVLILPWSDASKNLPPSCFPRWLACNR